MTSYKSLWEQSQEEVEELRGEVDRLRALIAASPDELRREVERTRQVVDLAGIARHMGVERYTPQQWKQRGHLPPVDFPLIKEPLWYVSTLREKFVIPSRRLWHDFPPGEALSPAA